MTLRRSLFVLIVVTLVACGKRGDPKPPVPVIPQATTDLVVAQRANQVILSWSYPSLTTAGRSLTEIRRIAVYRLVEGLPATLPDKPAMLPGDIDTTLPRPVALFSKVPTIPAGPFARLATRLESIEGANLATATTGSRLLFTDHPPLQTTDGRPVRLTYAVVTEGATARGDFSNLAIVIPLPVAVAPSGLKAEAKPEGVVLNWNAPTASIGAADAPVITGYHVYRTAPGQAPGALDSPITSTLVVGTTFTDVPPHGEHEYRVSAVAAEGPPVVQSALSNTARATFRDLVPPPVPTGLTALVETQLVRLLWDAVQSADLAGYNVYRVRGSQRTKLSGQPVTATNFSDEGVEMGVEYRYEVTAVDRSGNESGSVSSETVAVARTP